MLNWKGYRWKMSSEPLPLSAALCITNTAGGREARLRCKKLQLFIGKDQEKIARLCLGETK